MSKPRQDLPAGRQGNNVQIPDSILRELLTSSEIRMLKNRFKIMNLLQDGLSIRKIAGEVGVGSDTVVRMVRRLEKSKLKNFRKIKGLTFKTSTPWIFGKNT